MGPDWKLFVDELIRYFNYDPKKDWTGERVAAFIKDMEIVFLEKALKIMDEKGERDEIT